MFFSLDIIKEITSREYLTRGTGSSGTTATKGTTTTTGSTSGSTGTDNDGSIDALLKDLVAKIDSMGLRYEYEERAAILEYDGGMTRKDADRVAAVEILNRKPYDRNLTHEA